MKKIIEVDSSDAGLESLLGEKVLLMCMNYFYHGTLAGVNEKDVLLSDAHIVYETGSWNESGFKDAQRVCDALYVRIDAIESYALIP